MDVSVEDILCTAWVPLWEKDFQFGGIVNVWIIPKSRRPQELGMKTGTLTDTNSDTNTNIPTGMPARRMTAMASDKCSSTDTQLASLNATLSNQEVAARSTVLLALSSDDVLRHIFDWISLKDLGRCARVCKVWSKFLEKEEDILWQWKGQSTHWTLAMQSKKELRQHFLDNEQLALALCRGNYVQDCHQQRSWLLCGHSKKVIEMAFFRHQPPKSDNQRGYILTIGEDGEIRSWKLPLESNRPKSTVLLQLEDCTTYVPGKSVEWLPDESDSLKDDEDTTSSRGIIAGRKKIFVVEVQLREDDELSCRLIQSTELDCYMTCFRLDTQSLDQRLIIGTSDSMIRVYNLRDERGKICSAEQRLQVEPSNNIVHFQEPLVLTGHAGCVHSLAFGGQDGILYSRSSDQTVRMWNITTGECLKTLRFDGSIGGVSFLGFSRSHMAVMYDSLHSCSVRICRATDGSLVQELATESRLSSTYLQEQSLLCGTVDGSIVGFDLTDGSQAYYFGQLLGSDVISVEWLVIHQWILAIGSDGEMCLVRASDGRDDHTTSESTIVSRIALRFRDIGGMAYSSADKTLLIASSGYLVRAFVFES